MVSHQHPILRPEHATGVLNRTTRDIVLPRHTANACYTDIQKYLSETAAII